MPTDIRGGFPTFWSTKGAGDRQALMVHCSLAHQGSWNGVISQLETIGQFICFDLPGHGKSGDWDDRGEFQTICTAMAIDFIDTPIDIIGHSFGATVALRLAVKNPELVRSLTLIEPVYFAATQGTLAFEQHAAEFAPFVQAMQAGEKETATREFIQIWGDGTPWENLPEPQKLSATKRIHLIAAHATAIFEDPAGVLVSGRLEQLQQPVLLLEGSQSPPIIDTIQSRLSERLPKVTRHKIADASHMLPITHAVQVAEKIREFWADNPAN